MTKKATVSRLREPDRHDKYERLLAATHGLAPLATAVAHPCDESSLRGVLDAAEARLIVPILVGPKDRIAGVADKFGLDIGGLQKLILLGSEEVGEEALIRFYLFHVMVLPLILVALMAVHFWRIRRDGFSGPSL